ncbi:ATP-binding protein [Celeribacter litoreus]|uniref:ATP-binding protein n=1 Tax=Celeribacter litoreus TaxID=2876714 RepID=UPI001CCA4C8A|nr:ATP-binding protein [Celeribacter litoreus]MCA0045113.1 ATP-binding protein [Celeribacter litoreus]
MTKQWECDEQVLFDECVFADNYVEQEVRDFLSPDTTDNLLLWGLPGTGKSTVVKAIAFERYGTTDLQEHGVTVFNCKDKEQAKRFNSKFLRNSLDFACLHSDCPLYIIDELDELSDAQQRELTAFIDFSNSGQLRSMVLATTNVDLHDQTAREKAFSSALLSRFNTKLEMRQQPPNRLLALAQKMLHRAGVAYEDEALLEVLNMHCDLTSKTLDIRTVQTVVNKLIRRRKVPSENPPPKPSLRLV